MSKEELIEVISSRLSRNLEMMRKRTFIVGIIIFSIIIVGILAVSPILIDSRVNPNSQWIAFYASYLGGIFGGIVSGSLTLGGVYLTIRHQNKLLNQEKAAKISHVCRRLRPKFWSLNEFIKNKQELSPSEQVYKIKTYAEHFLEVIGANNKHIMESDFTFIGFIESVTDTLKYITDYNFNKSDQEIIKDFSKVNRNIQIVFKAIQEYEKSLR